MITIRVKSKTGKIFHRRATINEMTAFSRQQIIVAQRERFKLTFAKIGKLHEITPSRARQLYLKGKKRRKAVK